MRRALMLVTTVMALSSTLHSHAADKAAEATQAAVVTVVMKTSQGDIELQLDRSKAPISVDNFLTYAEADHYDGTVFHRVIRDFMIQGGGFDENMVQKATLPPIKNEAENGLKNDRGTIAMARTGVVEGK